MDAEDILQESFVTAFEKLSELSDYNAFGSWLKRIVINNCISHIRKSKIVFDDIDNYAAAEYSDDADADLSIDPILVHYAIRELPLQARAVLVLHAMEGYKHREISEMLGISESTSKSQYKRALDLLFIQLKGRIYVS
jgi:RNA polymerase sigma factor (sigma-70 family)